MNDYKVVIDAAHGGEDIGNNQNDIIEKDYTLRISEYIHNRLNELGIDNILTRVNDSTLSDTDRVNIINNKYGKGDNVIVISNHIGEGTIPGVEIIYALRNDDDLSKIIANNILNAEGNINKYYQRRLPSDTSLDYYPIIRNTSNNESIIIEYGNINDINDVNYLKNNLEVLGEAVVTSIRDYITKANTYTVVKGDTLYSIATKFNTTVNDIKELNGLNTNSLTIGQVLQIPKKLSGGSTNNNTNNNTSSTGNTYTVKKGDTLYSIARKYNITVNELKSLNNLTSNTLSIGQVLKVSNGNDNETSISGTYIVKRGDTLYSIARQYNMTVGELKSLNNLTSNSLSIGQVLKVDNDGTYIVQKGDNLYSIATKLNTTVNELKSLNNLTSNILSIGQILKIPQ